MVIQFYEKYRLIISTEYELDYCDIVNTNHSNNNTFFFVYDQY
jgi:hypothetical protein